MANIDLKKTHKTLYAPSAKTVNEVTVPSFNYLMLDGEGDPNTAPAYAEAVSVLYALAYGIRAVSKAAGTVYTVMPLEGLWWWEEMPRDVPSFLSAVDKSNFLWTMMILQPDHVTPEMVEAARQTVAKKKKNPPRLEEVRFERYDEGDCVQIMHIGPYADEAPTVKRLHDHIAENGYALRGKHHEIYLSDPRKVAPEKMKTVIRQPFARA